MSKSIGVIVPEIKHTFFAAILDGIEDVAFQKGYALKIGQSKEDLKREEQEIEALLDSGIDGLLVSVSQNTKSCHHLKKVIDRSVPLVLFDRVCSGIDVSTIVVDDFEGAFKATEHLILHGYERIAHLAGPQHILGCKNRFDGYRAALGKYDMPFREDFVIQGDLAENAGKEGLRNLLSLKNKPDAVFAINDPVAIGALLEIKREGFHIREDIGLIGFSDNPVTALMDPPLTTVAEPRYEIGKVAAEILIDQINHNGKKYKPVERVLKTKLIVRQSSGTPKKTKILTMFMAFFLL